ncbi:MAG: hypothetical protein QOE54_2108, partial [Streptosporangiaceae bacterium]|nr:hypothetical protein [Streptosporangiaceae bacterium]
AGFEAADQAIHFHGGIEFTWEHGRQPARGADSAGTFAEDSFCGG